MPQITLKKADLDKLSAFLHKHDQKNWFLAKDDGAYVGATGGSQEDGTFENCLFYFKGMDPRKDEDYYDATDYAFGGDDFGEHFDAKTIHKLADDPLTEKLVINVGAASISLKSWARKAPKNPPPMKMIETPPPVQVPAKKGKVTIGHVATQAIMRGLTDEQALKEVKDIFPNAKTTLNSIRWYRSQSRKAA